MATLGSEQAPLRQRRAWRLAFGAGPLRAAAARVSTLFADSSELSLIRRLASAAFVIRVVAAFLAFVSQILLARWLGGREFGIYVYAWTWLLLIGGVVDLGLGSAAQRFVPEYSGRKQDALLRGFLRGGIALALLIATAIALAAAGIIALLPDLGSSTAAALALACTALPAFGIAQVLSGIARSYNWVNLGLIPTYVLRQVLLIALVAALHAAGAVTDAASTMLATAITLWICTIGQFLVLRRRLAGIVAPGPRHYARRLWLKTAMPISLVEGFFYLLTYADVIMLSQFRPPADVAVYYAAAKTMTLVAFIYFAVAQTVAHKFSAYDVGGDRGRLADFLEHAIRLTFWPSVALIAALLALGEPLLRMFGRDFVAGYPLMFIIAIGLLARASVGPAERLLNMLGERRACAQVYAGSFAVNIVVCVALIPHLGVAGAAVGNAAALVGESAALFLVAKRRLGFHCFVFGRPRER